MMPQKTHGTVEEVLRLDSFEAKQQYFCGTLWAISKDGDNMPFDCVPLELDRWHDAVKVQLTSIMFSKSWQNTVDIDWIINGFGGTRAYWLCPCCGKKFRYLYLIGDRFKCKVCGNLNYRVQQTTRKSYWKNELDRLPRPFRIS